MESLDAVLTELGLRKEPETVRIEVELQLVAAQAATSTAHMLARDMLSACGSQSHTTPVWWPCSLSEHPVDVHEGKPVYMLRSDSYVYKCGLSMENARAVSPSALVSVYFVDATTLEEIPEIMCRKDPYYIHESQRPHHLHAYNTLFKTAQWRPLDPPEPEGTACPHLVLEGGKKKRYNPSTIAAHKERKEEKKAAKAAEEAAEVADEAAEAEEAEASKA